jgi:hypothetical protein
MGALPTPQPAHRYSLSVDELHGFFADNHLYFGVPNDILALNERLRQPGEFREQMTSLLQSIAARERGSIPPAELLEIVAFSIGGPQLQQPSPELHQPLSELYDFVAGVRTSERGAADVVPFARPGSEEIVRESEFVDTASTMVPPTHIRGDAPLDPSALDAPVAPAPAPPFGKLLMAAGIAVVLAIILAICLRPRSASPPSVVTHPAGATSTAHPSKPSAYGQAFHPTPPARKRRARPPNPDGASPSGASSSTQPVSSNR